MSGVMLPSPIRHHVVDRDKFFFIFTKSLFGIAGLKLEWIQTVKLESGMYLDVTRCHAEFKLLLENIL